MSQLANLRTGHLAQVILDSIVNRQYTSRSDARRLIIPSFQATGLDGELKIMRLVAPGLYTVQYVGSILIPNHVEDLQQLRKKCLPRLYYMKIVLRIIPLLLKEALANGDTEMDTEIEFKMYTAT
ncbi:hypothetical protein CU097_001602, partial [Rhizopus azygosporus]